MSGTTKYAVIETALCIGGNLHEGEVLMVRADEHDRELSALQEELADCQKVLSYSGNEADAYSTAALHTELEDTQQHLTAAEQRNAELVELLDLVRDEDGHHYTDKLKARIAAALKPNESGASE